MTTILKGKQIVLAVSGGIAAYKSPELLRLLIKAGAEVRVIMTRNAEKFVGRTTFEALSGKPVFRRLFDPTDADAAIKHIDWAEEAQCVVIAPATANILAKFAGGIADDALSTFLLAVTRPIVICPSMNTDMYLSPPVQRNLDLLKQDGHLLLEPGSGELACGTVGPGRLPEPKDILDRIKAALTVKDLSGKRVLVSAGPTQEPIDPVRFISNPSSGKMGYAIARAAEYRGAEVRLVSGPTHLDDPLNIKILRVKTAHEMADAVLEAVDDSDIIIKTAAVSDYRPDSPADHKIKKGSETMVLSLEKNPDILKKIGEKKKNQFLVGFAAETQHLKDNALAKLESKNLDMIAGNLVNQPASGFAVDTNKVTLFYRDGTKEELPSMEKDAVADTLLDRVIARLPS
jgi:phosphopantothenoylcysteine decarboxylase/phosphopantothenate--cysteine ligase